MVGFVVYLFVVLGVGIAAYRRTSTQSGFVLGDRKLGPWVIAFSERASGESAWLLLGVPGTALMAGFLELWTAIGCATGIFLSWTVVATKLRREVGNYDSLTLPDYFRSRYPETHEFIRIASSLIIVFFYTFYVASQFNGAGKVLDETFGGLLLSVKDTLGPFHEHGHVGHGGGRNHRAVLHRHGWFRGRGVDRPGAGHHHGVHVHHASGARLVHAGWHRDPRQHPRRRPQSAQHDRRQTAGSGIPGNHRRAQLGAGVRRANPTCSRGSWPSVR